MKIDKTPLGVFMVSFAKTTDSRGSFTKTFHKGIFTLNGLIGVEFKESFVTVSERNVIRGMHYQRHPHATAKLVYVIAGSARDVVLDITNKAFEIHNLVPGQGLFIPQDKFAHGFLALEDNTVMCYHQTDVYHQECDCGIRFDSFGCDWGVHRPVISGRDWSFPTYRQYEDSLIERWVG